MSAGTLEPDRLVNKYWTRLVEDGDYTATDQTIAKCSVCGEICECQILCSASGKRKVKLCISCLGGTN